MFVNRAFCANATIAFCVFCKLQHQRGGARRDVFVNRAFCTNATIAFDVFCKLQHQRGGAGNDAARAARRRARRRVGGDARAWVFAKGFSLIYNFHMSILKIYSDGACSGNQNETNIGGWGTILEFGETTKEIYGGEANTTNNKMELTAVIQAFHALKRDGLKVQVFTDSSYVANCFREKWYEKWRMNGWMTSKKEPVDNRELWEELIALTEKHEVIFYRVKGHVNLDHPNTDTRGLFDKFKETNGPAFSYDDFVHITKRNNRADALANLAMDEIRNKL